jgi:AcrR family transcriptional regulator
MDRALALAALSGLKLTLGPAFLAAARQRPEARNWVFAALGEMALDKIGVLPPRYRLPLLVPRALAGAYVAHEAMKEEGEGEVDPKVLAAGFAVAAGAAIAAPIVRMFGRRVLGVPDPVLAVLEDYLALRLGSQATGMSMGQIADEARGAFDQIKDQAMPMLEQLREQAMPMVEQVASRVGIHVGHGNGASVAPGGAGI